MFHGCPSWFSWFHLQPSDDERPIEMTSIPSSPDSCNYSCVASGALRAHAGNTEVRERGKEEPWNIKPGWYMMMDDIWWYMMIYDIWWLMIYDDIWWYMMIYGDIWWYMMIYDDIWWYMMIYDDIRWYMMIYDDLWWMIWWLIWWFVMIYDDLWW